MVPLHLFALPQISPARIRFCRHGSDELRRNYLAPTIAGDYVACLGVSEAIAGFEQTIDLDIIAIDLHDCIKCLANITGEDYTEELLDGIFANFCIGK